MSGLLETLVIESDGEANLKLALAIPLTWDSKISHFAMSKDGCGRDVLHLFWTDKSNATKPGRYEKVERTPTQLPFVIDTPEKLYSFVHSWLTDKGREFGHQSGDGSDVKGWRVEKTSDFYEVCSVTARWNYYSK